MSAVELTLNQLAQEIALLRMQHHPERSVKSKEAALFLGISPTTLRRFVNGKLLTPIMLTEDMTFELADLKRLRSERKGASESLLRVLERKAA